MFERFLNPERVSMPDFDIDFCDTRRGEVIDYVRRRYGEDHVAQIVTFGTLAARAAVRDVGRALGMSYAAVDEIAKMIPQDLHMTLARRCVQCDIGRCAPHQPQIPRRAADAVAAHLCFAAVCIENAKRRIRRFVRLQQQSAVCADARAAAAECRYLLCRRQRVAHAVKQNIIVAQRLQLVKVQRGRGFCAVLHLVFTLPFARLCIVAAERI